MVQPIQNQANGAHFEEQVRVDRTDHPDQVSRDGAKPNSIVLSDQTIESQTTDASSLDFQFYSLRVPSGSTPYPNHLISRFMLGFSTMMGYGVSQYLANPIGFEQNFTLHSSSAAALFPTRRQNTYQPNARVVNDQIQAEFAGSEALLRAHQDVAAFALRIFGLMAFGTEVLIHPLAVPAQQPWLQVGNNPADRQQNKDRRKLLFRMAESLYQLGNLEMARNVTNAAITLLDRYGLDNSAARFRGLRNRITQEITAQSQTQPSISDIDSTSPPTPEASRPTSPTSEQATPPAPERSVTPSHDEPSETDVISIALSTFGLRALADRVSLESTAIAAQLAWLEAGSTKEEKQINKERREALYRLTLNLCQSRLKLAYNIASQAATELQKHGSLRSATKFRTLSNRIAEDLTSPISTPPPASEEVSRLVLPALIEFDHPQTLIEGFPSREDEVVGYKYIRGRRREISFNLLTGWAYRRFLTRSNNIRLNDTLHYDLRLNEILAHPDFYAGRYKEYAQYQHVTMKNESGDEETVVAFRPIPGALPLSEGELVSYEYLEQLYRLGFVHRDPAPSNFVKVTNLDGDWDYIPINADNIAKLGESGLREEILPYDYSDPVARHNSWEGTFMRHQQSIQAVDTQEEIAPPQINIPPRAEEDEAVHPTQSEAVPAHYQQIKDSLNAKLNYLLALNQYALEFEQQPFFCVQGTRHELLLQGMKYEAICIQREFTLALQDQENAPHTIESTLSSFTESIERLEDLQNNLEERFEHLFTLIKTVQPNYVEININLQTNDIEQLQLIPTILQARFRLLESALENEKSELKEDTILQLTQDDVTRIAGNFAYIEQKSLQLISQLQEDIRSLESRVINQQTISEQQAPLAAITCRLNEVLVSAQALTQEAQHRASLNSPSRLRASLSILRFTEEHDSDDEIVDL